ncbi:S1/P1 nuclease [Marinihelvus fidelis]|uniref:S1/P1 nuclease n=1 Tax=Marinihelvus fidelis TaxID=2613842 RepID=A0A5N0T8T9_9GAMM|nr:S1/P1 nuclease [Marinihelvus fidelis]KAA9130557.1 S1/P1 nuclease [Marinihelvus fidelis]
MRVRVSPSAPFVPLLLLLASLAPSAVAWDGDGHAAIGVLAVEQASPVTRQALSRLLAENTPGATVGADTIAAACRYPDAYRETAGGEWSAPLHYVNIDPGSNRYSAARDCPGGQCVVAAVAKYAGQLGDPSLEPADRARAFGFLCHFMGDLHQPLHVGYADDRGGNLVSVRYRGEKLNLHAFWDHALPEHFSDGWRGLADTLEARPNTGARAWNTAELIAWTNETFSVTRNFAYPPSRDINDAFAQRSWQVTLQQMDMAAERLTLVLNSELGND